MGRSLESLYSGPTHLLGARPSFWRSFWELLAMVDRCYWRRMQLLKRRSCVSWKQCFMGLWYTASECKIGRSYTMSRWIWWYAEEWVMGCADKSKGLSLSAGRFDSAAWSVACARPRSKPSLNPEPCYPAAGYFAAVIAPNLLNLPPP